jgi:excinuclease ABC subunit B
VESELLAGSVLATAEPEIRYHSLDELHREIIDLEKKMQAAAKQLAFEEAAGYRDRIRELKLLELSLD